MPLPRFRFTDESVNAYGFRILVSGIDTSSFKKNPVMLWKHERYDPRVLPIGKWDDLKSESNELTAMPILDEKDEFAKQIMGKVEDGFINACSVGIEVIEWSEDPKLMLPGQTRATVTKCILLECSLVDIPGNSNAVRLYKDGKIVQLGIGEDNTIPLINQPKPSMKAIALKLGLPESATEAEILAKIGEMTLARDNATTELTNLKNQNKAELERKAKEMVQLALHAGKITQDKVGAMEKLAIADFESTKTALELIPPVRKPIETMTRRTPEVPGAQTEPYKTFAELQAAGRDEYERVRAEEPETFKKLYRAQYGRDPQFS